MKTESNSAVNFTVAAIPIRDGLHTLPSAIGGSGDPSPFKVFIYILSDPITDEVRYVGKTLYLRKRYMEHLGHARRNKRKSHKNSWIRGLILKGLEPRMKVVQEVISCDEVVWQEAERRWIEFYQAAGCVLTNLASGGHGGMKHSEESKEKMRKIQNSPEVIAKQRAAKPHNWMTPEHEAKLRLAGSNPEARKKMRLSVMRTWREKRFKNNLEFNFLTAGHGILQAV